MAFGSVDDNGSGGRSTVSEINMVPLIDVMLVLLVIFIITAPRLAHSIKINIPQASAEQMQEALVTVDLALDANGALFWNAQPVQMDALAACFQSVVGDKSQPEIRIRGREHPLEILAQVMATARRSGM